MYQTPYIYISLTIYHTSYTIYITNTNNYYQTYIIHHTPFIGYPTTSPLHPADRAHATGSKRRHQRGPMGHVTTLCAVRLRRSLGSSVRGDFRWKTSVENGEKMMKSMVEELVEIFGKIMGKSWESL